MHYSAIKSKAMQLANHNAEQADFMASLITPRVGMLKGLNMQAGFSTFDPSWCQT